MPSEYRRSRVLTRVAVAGLFVMTALSGCSDQSATDSVSPQVSGLNGPSFAQGEAALRRDNGRATLVDAVGLWNDNIVSFATAAVLSPPVESRIYAVSNVAIHDVMNAVDRRYESYSYTGQITEPVSVEAAIATAAHDVLAAFGASLPAPAALALTNQAYADYMNELGAGPLITRGVQLGHAAASSILTARAGDGSVMAPATFFTSTGEAGKYRPTLAPSPDGLSGLQALAGWGAVAPFVLTSGSQFRPSNMYGVTTVAQAVATPAYLADYAEVKRLGGVVSERTQDQSDIGVFWVENTAPAWTRIARVLAEKQNLDAWKLARLNAQMSLAIADGYVSVFEAKYFFNFWRPVTAIRLGNLDVSTPGDPTWNAASTAAGAGPTPPIPEFSSAHATAASAAAEAILANIGGPGKFTVESATLPGKPRSFKSLHEAVSENADSRIYIGFHFREATRIGNEQGKLIGQYVATHSLQPVRGRSDH